MNSMNIGTIRTRLSPKWMIDFTEESFMVNNKLGKGTYSEVYLVTSPKDKKQYALKKYAIGTETEKYYKDELLILQLTTDCKQIIGLIGVIKEKKYILLEYMEMSLINYMKIYNMNIGVLLSISYAKQIAMGIKELHIRGIYHCDIKPANLMINREGSIKIIDFSSSFVIISNQVINKSSIDLEKIYICTETYRSIEFFFGKTATIDDIKALDVWSLGVVIFEMFTGKEFSKNVNSTIDNIFSILNKIGLPSESEAKELGFDIINVWKQSGQINESKISFQTFIRNIFKEPKGALEPLAPEISDKKLEEFIDLMEKIFILNQKKRIDIDSIIAHPFMDSR